MDSFIIIEGLPLWIFLALFIAVLFCIIYLGMKYIEETREHDETRRELNCVRCNLSRKNEELYKLKTNIQLAKLEVD